MFARGYFSRLIISRHPVKFPSLLCSQNQNSANSTDLTILIHNSSFPPLFNKWDSQSPAGLSGVSSPGSISLSSVFHDLTEITLPSSDRQNCLLNPRFPMVPVPLQMKCLAPLDVTGC